MLFRLPVPLHTPVLLGRETRLFAKPEHTALHKQAFQISVPKVIIAHMPAVFQYCARVGPIAPRVLETQRPVPPSTTVQQTAHSLSYVPSLITAVLVSPCPQSVIMVLSVQTGLISLISVHLAGTVLEECTGHTQQWKHPVQYARGELMVHILKGSSVLPALQDMFAWETLNPQPPRMQQPTMAISVRLGITVLREVLRKFLALLEQAIHT